MSHNLNFLDQALLSFFFTVCSLFGEGLNCIPVFILVFFDQIHRSEVSLSDFIESLELFMESSLIKLEFENNPPCFKVFVRGKLVGELGVAFFEEDLFGVLLESEFQIKIEEHTLFRCLIVKTVFVYFNFSFGSFP